MVARRALLPRAHSDVASPTDHGRDVKRDKIGGAVPTVCFVL
jgi:hypothetical protein